MQADGDDYNGHTGCNFTDYLLHYNAIYFLEKH